MSVIKVSIALIVLMALGVFSWKKPRLSSVLIWSVITTIFLVTVALMTLPIEFASKAQWLTFLVPIILISFQYWCYWVDSEWVALFTLIATSLLSGGIIMMIDVTI